VLTALSNAAASEFINLPPEALLSSVGKTGIYPSPWFTVLLSIINESIEKGKFPQSWKLSTIIPIPKVKNTRKCEEFRPINTLPKYEQILEVIIKEQILHYLDKHNILCQEQSGFRSNNSCESASNGINVNK